MRTDGLPLTSRKRSQLEPWAKGRTTPARRMERAGIRLLLAEGAGIRTSPRRSKTSLPTRRRKCGLGWPSTGAFMSTSRRPQSLNLKGNPRRECQQSGAGQNRPAEPAGRLNSPGSPHPSLCRILGLLWSRGHDNEVEPRPVTANGWAASHMLACGRPPAHWTRSSQSFGERSEQGLDGVGRRVDSLGTLCVLSASACSAYISF